MYLSSAYRKRVQRFQSKRRLSAIQIPDNLIPIGGQVARRLPPRPLPRRPRRAISRHGWQSPGRLAHFIGR